MDINAADYAIIVVALITSVIAPTVLGRINTTAQLRVNRQNWRRQDAVAAAVEATSARLIESQAATARETKIQAAKAADLLLAAQAETIKRTDEVAKAAAHADADIQKQLVTIHKLVNSEMTAARQAELDQTRLLVAALRRVVMLGEHRGTDTSEDQEEIDAAEGRIRELRAVLAYRKTQETEMDKTSTAADEKAAAADKKAEQHQAREGDKSWQS